MSTSLRWLMLLAVLAGGVGLLADVSAQSALDTFRVRDNGNFFSKDAVDRANAKIARIKKEFDKDLLIETFDTIPEKLRLDKPQGDVVRDWARQRYRSQGVRGIYVLISREPRKLDIFTGKETLQKAFTEANRKELERLLIKHLKAEEFDKGLLAAVDYVGSTLEKNIGKQTGRTEAPATGTAAPNQDSGGMGLWGWVCVGLVVLLALWLVVGMFRSLSGAGSRPADYPPQRYGAPGAPSPGYAPPPTGGGGGFLSGLLGGMLGGAAGAWVYDSFFRGGSSGPSGPSMTPTAYGDTSAGPDDSEPVGGPSADWGDTSADDSASADWGGDDTGGSADWGGDDDGSADWGGGGDDGGSADW